jgi:hypothetical protein
MDARIDRRLKLVQLINKLFPKYTCWGACVGWAYGTSWNIFKIVDISGCKRESKTSYCKMCYCGYWQNGKPHDPSKIDPIPDVSNDGIPF